MIDATRIPVISQENYGFRYILQKMNFIFQHGEIYTKSTFMRFSIISIFTFQHGEIYTRKIFGFSTPSGGLYIPTWRDLYCPPVCARNASICFTFQHGEIYTDTQWPDSVSILNFTFQHGEIYTAVLPPFYA